jgi:hypothetical protein
VKGFSGGHRFVLDYLAEEVLDRQPELVAMDPPPSWPTPPASIIRKGEWRGEVHGEAQDTRRDDHRQLVTGGVGACCDSAHR